MWANGPYPCGSNPDIKIFKECLSQKLDPGEQVLADGSYVGDKCVMCIPGKSEKFSSQVRARHETANRRLKHFAVLGNRFRHKLQLHSMCFHAIVNLTQIILESSDSLFQINC